MTRVVALALALVVLVAVAVVVYQGSIPPPWPSLARPIVASATFSDSAGDVPSADLVGIRTNATSEDVIIELEFATADDRAAAFVDVVIAEPLAQGAPICSVSISPYTVQAGPLLSAALIKQYARENVALEEAIDGPRLSVAVPLSLIDDPSTLHFAVATKTRPGAIGEGELADHSPDAPDACHAASLGP